jgi:UrcA family protein
MITHIPTIRMSITLVAIASASLPFMNCATAQDDARKVQRSVVTVRGDDEDGTVVKVRFHDLNLRTDAGVTALYHRIKVAAHAVCYQSVPVWVPQRNQRLQQCLDSAVDTAVVQVGNAQLAAVHQNDANSKNGG